MRIIQRLYLAAGAWPGLAFLLLFHWALYTAAAAVFLALIYGLAHLIVARTAGRVRRLDLGLLFYLGLLLVGLILWPGPFEPLFEAYFFFGLYSTLFLVVAAPLWLDLGLFGSETNRRRFPSAHLSRTLTVLWAGLFLIAAAFSLGEGVLFKVILPGLVLLLGRPLAWWIGAEPKPRLRSKPRRFRRFKRTRKPTPSPPRREPEARPQPASKPQPLPRLGPVRETLVIQGSSSQGTGLTKHLLRPLLAGLNKEKVPVEVVRLKELDLKPCLGCFDCWTRTPGVCAIADDMAPLLKRLSEADLVVLATPLWFGSVSTLTKTFLDRCLPLQEPWLVAHPEGGTFRPPRAGTIFGRRLALLTPGSMPNEAAFSALEGLAQSLAAISQAPLVGRLVRPGADILLLGRRLGPAYEAFNEALFRSGLELARLGRVLPETEKAVSAPLFSNEVAFRLVANLFWETCQEYHAAKRAGLELPELEEFVDNDIRMNLGGMTLSFNPELVHEDEITYQFSLSGRQPGQWYLKIKSGRCSFHEGWTEAPDLIISTPSEIWVAVVRGEINLTQAVRDNLVRLEGRTELFSQIAAAFGWIGR